ncbi:MAG: aminodeoxychorismate synthase component I [bacterium]
MNEGRKSWKALRSEPGLAIMQKTDWTGQSSWLLFEKPIEVLEAHDAASVAQALERVEAAVHGGLSAAGFISYEAAPAFDPALTTRPAGNLPLLWFGLYRKAVELESPADRRVYSRPAADWTPSLKKVEYARAVDSIKQLIAAGDTYQVNYSFRLRSPMHGDALVYFHSLCLAQRAKYCAYVDTGDAAVCSASPELFFHLERNDIVCKPMKGTAPRGVTWADDCRRAKELRLSAKNRAENVMIVDMLRNDLGRIAGTGTVRVQSLFDVERYPTLFQLTSTVSAQTDATIPEIFQALFPCASVTGAPKIRTMQIIRDLEPEPRGVYTGSMGFVLPDRKAQFNVAIRTVQLARKAGVAEYGTGGGVVWDSIAGHEYEECCTKALVLATDPRPFELLETLLWKPGTGYFLEPSHLARLADSAQYFDYSVDIEEIRKSLHAFVEDLPRTPHRVRLTVNESGRARVEAAPVTPLRGAARTVRTALAADPVHASDRFLYHKTTRREVYDRARAARPGMDDVILWNERGEVTESTVANVVVRFGKNLVTPPVTSGLLAGTLRAALLARGRIREQVVSKGDLARADAVYFVNSVRGWMRCVVNNQ